MRICRPPLRKVVTEAKGSPNGMKSERLEALQRMRQVKTDTKISGSPGKGRALAAALPSSPTHIQTSGLWRAHLHNAQVVPVSRWSAVIDGYSCSTQRCCGALHLHPMHRDCSTYAKIARLAGVVRVRMVGPGCQRSFIAIDCIEPGKAFPFRHLLGRW